MYYDMSNYVFLFFFSTGLLVLSYKYYLLVLVIMELVVMNMVVVVYTFMGLKGLNFMFIYYLIFSVCESVLGLGVLVLVIRTYGNDYYNSVSVSKF